MIIEKRNHCVSVRFNESELEELDEIRGNRTRGSVIRECFFKQLPRPIPPINLDTFNELSRIGNNLNQIARHLNGGGDQIEINSVQKLIDQIYEITLTGINKKSTLPDGASASLFEDSKI